MAVAPDKSVRLTPALKMTDCALELAVILVKRKPFTKFPTGAGGGVLFQEKLFEPAYTNLLPKKRRTSNL